MIEHEILGVLYIKTSFYIGGYMRGDGKTVIMAKRDYKNATLFFGTLVDILNLPEKYKSDGLKSLQGLDLTQEEINIDTYKYGEVSNAIEVLEFNGQVVDTVIEYIPGKQLGSRKITLTNKGAIDYRAGFYLNEKERKELDRRQIQSVIDTNESVKKTNWRMVMLTFALVAVAIIGLIIEKLRDTRQQGTEQLLQMQVKSTSKTLQFLQEKDSLFEIEMKDSLKISKRK